VRSIDDALKETWSLLTIDGNSDMMVIQSTMRVDERI